MPIAANLTRIRDNIAAACLRAGRDPAQIRLLAVSKTRTPEEVRSAADSGATLFGENRVQEARDKIPLVERTGLEWHLIGPLQRNKVHLAVQWFHMIHTVDSPELAREISARAPEKSPMPVLIQVNLGQEPQKAGVDPAAALPLAETMALLPGIALRGLMAIPPWTARAEDARPWFRALAQLREEIRAAKIPGIDMQELSMGMSHDYEIAVEEGATLVRIGSAIFE
ncbi:MAG: YggS family pyridoxal phosphate-dependent enzyme [Magnetococcales bacterium]|nr:YggS family pyridoxal phosphate-dependent enzyme [Magnetococcales bacterium]